MEDKILQLENKCKVLETEKNELILKVKSLQNDNMEKTVDEKEVVEEIVDDVFDNDNVEETYNNGDENEVLEELVDLDDVIDERVLIDNKKSGFERLSPQASPIKKSNQKEFPCVECSFKLESKGLLDAHMQSHIEMRKKNNCDKCGLTFWTKAQLETHRKVQHVEDKVEKTRQYNCKDCPFQGENGLELKKHIQRTQHSPSEYIEQCYTCNKGFPSYRILMDHRKKEHPSKRECRYFKKDECHFDAETCWYKHDDKTEVGWKKSVFTFQCKECDDKFDSKSFLMSHKKI